MKRNVTLVFPTGHYESLMGHLFPGDRDEHAAILSAGYSYADGDLRLLVRDVHLAAEGCDYKAGNSGYRALQASFIHRQVTRCRDRNLAYIAVHNHGGRDSVAFSSVDLASHERGYPALLDIAGGPPIGAAVAAQNAFEVDIWLPGGERLALKRALIVGDRLQRVYCSPRIREADQQPTIWSSTNGHHDRQELFLGHRGQALLSRAKVAVIGLGGIGSIVNEQLARLGVGSILLVDPDRIESSNFSRIVGATTQDLEGASLKIDIAARLAREANSRVNLELLPNDMAFSSVANRVKNVDYIFLAADTMRARLVFNAIVQQYYVPGVQMGSKITVDPATGSIQAAYSVVREVRPGSGCLLCNQLIDPVKLADEWKTDRERAEQHYGTAVPNPSVITLNAIAASHAVNAFFFWYTGIRTDTGAPTYRRFDHLTGRSILEIPRRDSECSECSTAAHSRLGTGDAKQLPCADT
jgi:molybdopterin/thiamine biosynthesis adenylyltransferase